MTPSTAPVRIPRWLSFDRTGIAHAFFGREQAAPCGARRLEDRYQWPRRDRCRDCVAAVEVRL